MASKYILAKMRLECKRKAEALDANENSSDVLLDILKIIAPVKYRSILETQSAWDKTTALNLAVSFDSVGALTHILDSLTVCERDVLMRMKTAEAEGEITCLHIAVNNKNTDMLEILFNSLATRPDYQLSLLKIGDEYGNTALHLAAQAGYTDGLTCILNHVKPCDRLNVLCTETLFDRYTSLHFALGNEHLEAAEVLLDCLRDDEERMLLIQQSDSVHSNVILDAVARKRPEVLKLLVRLFNPSIWCYLLKSRNNQNQTALYFAVKNNMLNLLLKSLTVESRLELLSLPVNGACYTPGNTSLHHAVANCNRQSVNDIMSLLTPETRLSLLQVRNHENKTVLQLAVDEYMIGAVTSILDFKVGSDRNKLIDLLSGTSILHRISVEGDHASLQEILKRLTDRQRIQLLTEKDPNGKTASSLACNPMLKLFLEWSKSQKGYYFLPKQPRVLVIYDEVNGAEKSRKTLENALWEFPLTSTFHQSLTHQETLNLIRESQVEDGGDISALIVVIMNQAQNKRDHQRNQSLVASDILSVMNSPDMENKPKVLVMQASPPSVYPQSCGTVNSGPAEDTEDHYKLSAYQQEASNIHIKHPDFLLLMSSTSDDSADERPNTDLISLLSEHLRTLGKKEDLHNVFLRTQQALTEMTDSTGSVKVYSSLTKKLCLRNVFNPDKPKPKSSFLKRLVANFRN